MTTLIAELRDLRNMSVAATRHLSSVVDEDRQSIVAHGASGAPDGRALDGATVSQLGSLTKVFTSLVLAEMVARGEVHLDDPVNELLPPEARIAVTGRAITLRDLATHTSGLPSMPDNSQVTTRAMMAGIGRSSPSMAC